MNNIANGLPLLPKLGADMRTHSQTLDGALQQIFATPQSETRLQKARRVMGLAVESTPDDDLEAYLTEFQYLLDEWLDLYEKSVFDGQTLRQLLGNG